MIMQLQENPQNTMSRLRWHHFTMGRVRAVPYKGGTDGCSPKACNNEMCSMV